MDRRTWLTAAASTLAATSAGLARGEGGWTQWRGPRRDGQVTGESWPAGLSEQQLKLAWSLPLGPSYSGPIVTEDRVFVTETVGKKEEVVRALDRATGKQVWESRWDGAMSVPFFAAANGSWIRATPAWDGERLYVAGIRDLLVCLDGATGKPLWKVDFVAAGTPLPSFGCVSSPLVIGDHVYVQAGAAFVKLDKLTGAVVWKSLQDKGGTYGSTFSSPVPATIAGRPQLVVQTRDRLAGVDVEDGKLLWSQKIEAFRGMNILTPTVIGDRVFTSSYGGKSLMFNVTHDNGAWKVEELWRHRSQAYMSSPVVVDGYLYLHLRNRRFLCLAADTGEQKWITEPFGKYWSVVVNGGRLLALDQRGELLLIEATPEKFQLTDRRQVADDSWAHLAVDGGQVFVRDLKAIKRFDWNGQPQ